MSLRQKSIFIQTYSPHSPVLITSNNQFGLYGFIGSGTYDDPYRIEHLHITALTGDLISINNTTAYFSINDNSLDGLTTATSGISLYNVQHGIIENNLINRSGDGIITTKTSDTIFRNNSIYSNERFGIFFAAAENCTLTSNSIHDNLVNGVHLKNTVDTTIINNEIYNHQYGEYAHSSILLDNSSSTLIANNSLYGNHYGINLLNSADNNVIANNSINKNQQYGIRLEYASKNSIEYNTISENLLYGIKVTKESNDNKIQFNSFIGNNNENTQATDEGANNIFTGNYWDDWQVPDIDGDLIQDNPYPLDGNVNNSDPYPLVIFSSNAIKNVPKNTISSGILTFILVIITVFGGSASVGYFVYKTRIKLRDTETDFELEESFIDLESSKEIERLKPLYDKIIVGIENLQTSILPQPVAVPLLEPAKPITLVELFPSDIEKDLRSGMKWRTILILIEIAYQDLSETNPKKLAKSLNIQASTLSKEIMKLKELHYIESFVSAQVLHDGRYRNYIITQKGFHLLCTLKETLKLTITRLKEKKDSYYAQT